MPSEINAALIAVCVIPASSSPLKPILVRANSRLTVGGRVRVRLTRPGTAIVRLYPVGAGPRRNILKVTVGDRDRTVAARVPPNATPGRYRVVVTLRGEGLSDQATTPVRLVAARR